MTITKEILKKFSDYPTFSYNDVELYLTNKAKNPSISRLLSHLKNKGHIYSIRKGIYSTKMDISLSGFAFRPFYYGLTYAITIRELWTQESSPEIITLKRVKKNNVKVFNGKHIVAVHHSNPKYFFGYENVKRGNINIPVSDPEKTLIDMFFYKKRIALQKYDDILKVLDRKKLKRYLKVYDKHTKATVNNFVKEYASAAKKGILENPY